MCTLTIQRDAAMVRVTMNRDERYERIETGLRQDDHTQMLFPEDGLSGGSWIGVNAEGVIVCLMNRYDSLPNVSLSSRGRIVIDALSLGGIKQVLSWLQCHFKPGAYNPFSLFVVSEHLTSRMDWTGEVWNEEYLPLKPWTMVTSSAEDWVAVADYREQQFSQWLSEGAEFVRGVAGFHFQSDPMRMNQSVLMQRAQSHTKSITQIALAGEQVYVTYLPRSAVNAWSSPVSEDQLGVMRARLNLAAESRSLSYAV